MQIKIAKKGPKNRPKRPNFFRVGADKTKQHGAGQKGRYTGKWWSSSPCLSNLFFRLTDNAVEDTRTQVYTRNLKEAVRIPRQCPLRQRPLRTRAVRCSAHITAHVHPGGLCQIRSRSQPLFLSPPSLLLSLSFTSQQAPWWREESCPHSRLPGKQPWADPLLGPGAEHARPHT